MALGERFNEGIRAEALPVTVGLPAVDQSTPQVDQLANSEPITERDILLAAGSLSKISLIQADGLPVAPRELLNRVNDEVYNPADWKKGRVVGARENVVALREDALARIARYLLSAEKSELPEVLRGPAVQDLLGHLMEYIGDGNLNTLEALIGNPQKAKLLVHQSHDIHYVELPSLLKPQ